MPRKGLTEEAIVKEASAIVAEKGWENMSLRELAERLDVKPPALYNHIGGINDLKAAIAADSGQRLNAAIAEAISGKDRDSAIVSAAYAYREFAMQNAELYNVIISIPHGDAARPFIVGLSPLRELIMNSGIDPDVATNFFRALRSALHGFVTLERADFMHYGTISSQQSFDAMVQGFLYMLKGLLEKHTNPNIQEVL
ncbi:MAG: TetR/AcrR family transcriptional regulator [Oscillospiraceae bacterium]